VPAPEGSSSQRWSPGSLLASLDPSDRRILLDLGIRRQYNTGDVLLAEGDKTTFVTVIVDGYVKITARTEDGLESLLAIRTAGDVIGELAALDSSPRSATARAAGAVVAITVSKRELEECFQQHPPIAVGFNRAVATKLRLATRHRVESRGRDAKQRLARALLELAEGPTGQSRRGDQGIAITQSELAALIGVSEPTVHKAVRELRETCLVDTRYRRLVITDLAGLRRIAGYPSED
jgi:CRP/FNR family transcriptional regulator, cyclic AMP receptor protein